jgi:hypothetical protein
MREAQDSVRKKASEIVTKTTEASKLRSKLPEYQQSLNQKQSDLAETRRRADNRKGGAFLGMARYLYVQSVLQWLIWLGSESRRVGSSARHGRSVAGIDGSRSRHRNVMESLPS